MVQASKAIAAAEAELAVLRVLAGPQRGAELALHAGEYLIGSGEVCDVVLADSAVAETHLRLSVTPEGVAVEAREKAVALIGQVLRPGEQADLVLPAVLTFGLTSIGIGALVSDWSGFALPEPPKEEEVGSAAAKEAAGSEDAAGEDLSEGASERNETGADGEEAVPETTSDGEERPPEPHVTVESEVPPSAEAPPQERRRWLPWTLLAVFVSAALAAWLFLGGMTADEADDAKETVAAPATNAVDRVAALVEELDLPEVAVKRGPTGEPILTGYVPDPAAQADLRRAVQAAGFAAEDRTRDVESLMDNVSLTLGSFSWPEPGFGTHLRASYAGAGAVVVDGYLGPEVDRNLLRRRLLGDVPGIDSLEFHRAGLKEWKDMLDRRLSEAGLGQWLTTETSAGMIRVTGEVTAREAETWRAVGQGFVNDSGGWPKLAIAVTSARPGIATGVAPLAETVVGAEQVAGPEVQVDLEHPAVIGVILSHEKPARVLLAGGLSLLQGDRLDNGITVKSVSAHKVVFNKGEQEFVVYVKESR